MATVDEVLTELDLLDMRQRDRVLDLLARTCPDVVMAVAREVERPCVS